MISELRKNFDLIIVIVLALIAYSFVRRFLPGGRLGVMP